MTAQRTLSEPQRLALDTILKRPVKGVGVWLINPMEWRMIDRLAGLPEGSYTNDPIPAYRKMLVASGCCMVDQWIPRNPLTMGARGFEGDIKATATTGDHHVALDGIAIDSPEAVVAHLERFIFPKIEAQIAGFDEDATVAKILEAERETQDVIGDQLLKTPYGHALFPHFAYSYYGYENYFMAYALYPEVVERHFKLQADYAARHNGALARAYAQGGLPPYIRADHDMANSSGTLVDVRSLDRLWFGHFARSIEPLVRAGITVIWHCDGNLMQMVPRLLEVGIKGFQGFQYEDGMDYPGICGMKARDGDDLLIIGGVSVTTTLPHGTPEDVKKQTKWLVECGPKRGLFLGASSSIAPGVPWANLKALVDGFWHYRSHGRDAG